jgi:ABC-type branched-subunit amino acid transport system substrate-binding protein
MKTRFWLSGALASLLLVALGARAAEVGVTDNEIRVGQFAAQTGPAAELGKRMQLGILAHFNAVNAAGGVNGRKLTLVSRDDGYEPEKAALAAKALIEEDKVFALIGSVGTPTTLAAVPAINAAGIPLIGPFTGAQALREPFNRNLFHVRASYFDETERIVQHLSTVGIKKIAVFYQNDSYGKAGLEGVMRALIKRNLKPAATVTVERNSIDVAAALAEIIKVSPEAVIQISAYKSCAALIKQAKAKSYGGQFFNVSFVGSKALADELGDSGAGVTISQVVPFPYTPSSAIVREYQQRMSEAGNKEFDFSSMEGFLAAKVFTEGLRKAGKNPSRESFVTALESLRDYNLSGFTVNYSAKSHEGSRYTDLTIIGRGGKFVH